MNDYKVEGTTQVNHNQHYRLAAQAAWQARQTPPAAPSVPSPPRRCYWAILDDQHGVLAMVDGMILFRTTATGALTTLTAEDVYRTMHSERLTLHGEIGLAETQYLLDKMHGGYAAIACTRPN